MTFHTEGRQAREGVTCQQACASAPEFAEVNE
jgi:hypothetical protein